MAAASGPAARRGQLARGRRDERPRRPRGGAAPRPPRRRARPEQLILLSARTAPALDARDRAARGRTSRPHRRSRSPTSAYTLQVGRRRFDHRGRSSPRAARTRSRCLESDAEPRRERRRQDSQRAPVAFLFPGQGAQYVEHGPRSVRDRARASGRRSTSAPRYCSPHLGKDLRDDPLSARRGRGAPRGGAEPDGDHPAGPVRRRATPSRSSGSTGACEPTA